MRRLHLLTRHDQVAQRLMAPRLIFVLRLIPRGLSWQCQSAFWHPPTTPDTDVREEVKYILIHGAVIAFSSKTGGKPGKHSWITEASNIGAQDIIHCRPIVWIYAWSPIPSHSRVDISSAD